MNYGICTGCRERFICPNLHNEEVFCPKCENKIIFSKSEEICNMYEKIMTAPIYTEKLDFMACGLIGLDCRNGHSSVIRNINGQIILGQDYLLWSEKLLGYKGDSCRILKNFHIEIIDNDKILMTKVYNTEDFMIVEAVVGMVESDGFIDNSTLKIKKEDVRELDGKSLFIMTSPYDQDFLRVYTPEGELVETTVPAHSL